MLVRPFIIASKDIPIISNEDWAEWTRSILPNGLPAPKGAILAMSPETSFDTNETSELESYVEITPSQSMEPNRFKVDLLGQRIVILIHPDDKQDIDRVRSDEDTRGALFPSMYQRAIEEAIRQHRKEDNADKRWARRIAEKLADHGLEAEDQEILEANSLDYAQQIMENPLARITTLATNDQAGEE